MSHEGGNNGELDAAIHQVCSEAVAQCLSGHGCRRPARAAAARRWRRHPCRGCGVLLYRYETARRACRARGGSQQLCIERRRDRDDPRPIALGLDDHEFLTLADDVCHVQAHSSLVRRPQPYNSRMISRSRRAVGPAAVVACTSRSASSSVRCFGAVRRMVCCRLNPSSTLRSLRPLRQAYSSKPRKWLRYFARQLSVLPCWRSTSSQCR